ncbi:MAG: glycoside hydrolase family 15 protein [Actinomycetota bacterium]|nr:glycoside hydrolase family 15 protein [Actinomycetota bacterium]
MSLRLEDYALLGDTQTAALVGRDGSIDWLCLPRFDSGACFAALLGDERHGRWLIAPAIPVRRTRRRYRPGTLLLETEFETEAGVVRLVDAMPPRQRQPDVVRVVEGVRGRVPMRMELVIRFDYGSIVPWVVRRGPSLLAVAGPDALSLASPVEWRGEGLTTIADFAVSEGESLPFVLTWFPSHEPPPRPVDAHHAVGETERWWREWSSRSRYDGDWPEAVEASLIVLKALTYAPTGGVVAAPTTSLPEQLGGVRNWDYRYCWLRDATFTLYALMISGYTEEARAWRDWLLRAVAGTPAEMQILYGAAGERRLPERELPWLPGYEGSRPVRVGNGAVNQRQLDVPGEVMDSMHAVRRAGIAPHEPAWKLQRALLEHLESAWREPDEGIWEVRGPRRHFTHSKVMAWVGFDRAAKAVDEFGLPGDGDRWRRLREDVHAEVCREGFDAERGTFTQFYGSAELDGSLLMLPLVGFLPPEDERVRGTVEAIQRELCEDGFVLRYRTSESIDGLPPGEGAFLPCTFWLVDNLALMGRRDEARALFERLLRVRNDLGLLSEEYDPGAGRLVGNFPQAFSHVGLVNSARNASRAGGPAEQRREHQPRQAGRDAA